MALCHYPLLLPLLTMCSEGENSRASDWKYVVNGLSVTVKLRFMGKSQNNFFSTVVVMFVVLIVLKISLLEDVFGIILVYVLT